jgi:hypothetical protein
VIDRRHLVLGIALGASIATEGPPPGFLFHGAERLNAGASRLDVEIPTRHWIITTEIVLPREAEGDEFGSSSAVSYALTERSAAGVLVSSFRECGGEIDEEPIVTVDDSFTMSVSDSFADCAPQQGCTRTFCLELTSNNDHAIEVEWYATASIESEATVDHDVDPIDVPIEITIEEIEP